MRFLPAGIDPNPRPDAGKVQSALAALWGQDHLGGGASVTPAERSVWLILWRDTKPSGLAKTSQMSMARRAGVSDRSIRAALRGLEHKGLITVVRRGSL